jgi:tRNA pseudouridine13 synthase
VTRSNGALPDWAYVAGAPEASGVIRSKPEDFCVWELPSVQPDGEGNHLWLEIKKTGANTNWVAGQLARCAGVPVREIGFAGMKDRHGVTCQWFSVGLQEARCSDWESWSIEGVEFLQGIRHGRKLKRGTLAGNRFRIMIRQLEGETDRLLEAIERVSLHGAPNYFGEQRFGHGGRNVERARAWLQGGGRIRRNQRSIYLSAARSFLFNQVLSERVRNGSWNRLLDGEAAQLDGRNAVFTCELPDAELERRCREFDIHPTGPMPGRGDALCRREALELETAILEPETALVEALAGAGVDAARRSLRVHPSGLESDLDDDVLVLEFSLPSGAYATTVLRELVTVTDATMLMKSG